MEDVKPIPGWVYWLQPEAAASVSRECGHDHVIVRQFPRLGCSMPSECRAYASTTPGARLVLMVGEPVSVEARTLTLAVFSAPPEEVGRLVRERSEVLRSCLGLWRDMYPQDEAWQQAGVLRSWCLFLMCGPGDQLVVVPVRRPRQGEPLAVVSL